jgi:hypothetical protein
MSITPTARDPVNFTPMLANLTQLYTRCNLLVTAEDPTTLHGIPDLLQLFDDSQQTTGTCFTQVVLISSIGLNLQNWLAERRKLSRRSWTQESIASFASRMGIATLSAIKANPITSFSELSSRHQTTATPQSLPRSQPEILGGHS